MAELIQLVYCSAATRRFGRPELADLLRQARANNERCGVTGMLLHAEGSFFQVLEGPAAVVDALFAAISADARHAGKTLIVREPIAERAFSDWTMGFAEITPQELGELAGATDFLAAGEPLARIGPGRARKLLEAFRLGRWRSRLLEPDAPPAREPDRAAEATPAYTFAYQPIIHAPTGAVFSYEALLRGPAGEPAGAVLSRVPPDGLLAFDARIRVTALELAARLGLATRLNLNVLPSALERSPTALSSLLLAALRCGIRPAQIVLEILESELIRNGAAFAAEVHKYRGAGLSFAIDDFGAGYAGLNLLAEFQPDLVKVDMHLIRDIHSRGPRQAILRGILATCADLGIDLVAEGVERAEEYAWLRAEGVELFQGRYLAEPAFERLPDASARAAVEAEAGG